VYAAGGAKALVQSALARRWAQRDKITLRLPPSYLGLRPGALIQPNAETGVWSAERVTVDSLAVVVDLRPVYATAVAEVAADSGRIVASAPKIPVPTQLALIELPDDGTGKADSPVVAVAAAGASPWRPVPLRVRIGDTTTTMLSARKAGVFGSALSALPPGESGIFDLRNSVDVQLIDATWWLESRDDDAIAAGANMALLGSELLQFGNVLPLGDGAFRLNRLLRGRRGSEWAIGAHAVGDRFVLLEPAELLTLPLSRAQTGAVLSVTPGGIADSEAPSAELAITGEAMKPPAPVHLRATFDAAGNLSCSWVRRSSLGWDWLDGVDAPLGCAVERYTAMLQGGGQEVQIETVHPEAQFTAAQVAEAGSGDLALIVAQIGDYAMSRPSTLPIFRS
jgi:hypothetical protein